MLQKRIRFVQFSIIRKHVMRDRVVTDYIRKRLAVIRQAKLL